MTTEQEQFAARSPGEFAEHIQAIIRRFGSDGESLHRLLNNAMEELLITAGYTDGIELIRSSEARFYS